MVQDNDDGWNEASLAFLRVLLRGLGSRASFWRQHRLSRLRSWHVPQQPGGGEVERGAQRVRNASGRCRDDGNEIIRDDREHANYAKDGTNKEPEILNCTRPMNSPGSWTMPL